MPLLVWLERAEPVLWPNRLLLSEISPEPNRHTPLNPIGTYLPPRLTQDTVLTPDASPYLINRAVRIEPEAALTILPGVTILAHEFSQLTIAGTLISRGTSTEPIRFTTNELHPDNQTWNGLVFTAGGRGDITHTAIHYATPAVTCLATSQVTLDNVRLSRTSLGLFALSPDCRLRNSRVQSTRDGVVARGVEPDVTGTVFQVGRDAVSIFTSLGGVDK